jgi:hypothetical protein
MSLRILPMPAPSLKTSATVRSVLSPKPLLRVPTAAPDQLGTVVSFGRTRGRYCETCRHPERLSINIALIAGQTLRAVGARYDLSHSSVARHKRNCVPRDLLEARHSKEIADADFVLAKLCELERSVRRIAEGAEGKGDRKAALAAFSELRRLIEVQARMAVSVDDSTGSSHAASADVAKMVSTIVELFDDAEIRVKVANALSPLAIKPVA